MGSAFSFWQEWQHAMEEGTLQGGAVPDDLFPADRVTVTDIGVTDEVVLVETWDEVDFYTTFISTAYYEEWDLDDDNFLNEGEFTASFFQLWDTDSDGMIERIELDAAVTDFSLDGAAWDVEGDGYMDMADFGTGFADTGLFDAWDIDNDNRITEREYASGVFSVLDTNGDNLLDETEYRRFDTYYGV